MFELRRFQLNRLKDAHAQCIYTNEWWWYLACCLGVLFKHALVEEMRFKQRKICAFFIYFPLSLVLFLLISRAYVNKTSINSMHFGLHHSCYVLINLLINSMLLQQQRRLCGFRHILQENPYISKLKGKNAYYL